MKKTIILLLLILVSISCNKESDDNQDSVNDNIELWNLNAQYGIGITTFPEIGEVVWTFNFDTNILSISNNTDDVEFDSGNYAFTMTADSLFVPELTSSSWPRTEFSININDNERILYSDPLPNSIDDELSLEFTINE